MYIEKKSKGHLLNNNQLVLAVKDSLLGAISEYCFYTWLYRNHKEIFTQESYLTKLHDAAWLSLYPQFNIACGGDLCFTNNNYVDYRDQLLESMMKYFYQRINLNKEDIALLGQFFKWIQKSGFTYGEISRRIHISNYIHGLKSREIWQPEYAYSNAIMTESLEEQNAPIVV